MSSRSRPTEGAWSWQGEITTDSSVMPKTPEEARPSKIGLALRGLRILLGGQRAKESLDAAGSASLAVFGPVPQSATGKRGRHLVTFLKEVPLFEELGIADLKRLAQIVHERNYRDGEFIYEQGRPGVALFVVRSGLVEILRRKANGETWFSQCSSPRRPLQSWRPWEVRWSDGAPPVLAGRCPSWRWAGPISTCCPGRCRCWRTRS
jgi:hypothetical protein